MLAYVLRRLLFILPTLFGIMVINFFIVQAAPGGPVEVMIARARGTAVEATARVIGSGGAETAAPVAGSSSIPIAGAHIRAWTSQPSTPARVKR